MKRPPGRLLAEPGLRSEELHEIERLATACVEADGGRLKLEWGTLRSRPAEQLNDFMWIGGSGLVGFLGIYGYRLDQAELCGMVHPSARRQGIFSALFAAAMNEVGIRGASEALLVVDRTYEGGSEFARSVGGAIEHSEHRMILGREPSSLTPDPRIAVRPAETADGPFIVKCVSEAFDVPMERLEHEGFDALMKRFAGTLVIESAGEPVGTVRVDRDGDAAGVYGFAVTPAFQGRGIGRQVLSGLARDLPAEGVPNVYLEVSCTNDAALHLYVTCGFDVVGTEDYYAVAVQPTSTPSATP